MNKLILLSFIILLFILLNIFTKYENLDSSNNLIKVGPSFSIKSPPITKTIKKIIKDEKCEDEYNILKKKYNELTSINEVLNDENTNYKSQIENLKLSKKDNTSVINNITNKMSEFIKSKKKTDSESEEEEEKEKNIFNIF